MAVLLDTDQARCFDENGRTIPCTGSGQDAELKSAFRTAGERFQAAGAGVRDSQTGLTWCRDASPSEFPLDWQAAHDFVKELNAAHGFGLSGWRLPARGELFSLISHAAVDPALPAGHPFKNVFSGYCWTRSPCARLPDQAWTVHLGGGRVQPGMKHRSCMVWPVIPPGGTSASGAPQRGWAVRGEGALDQRTGLVWRRPADNFDRPVSWREALDTVDRMNRMAPGGRNDWRLPNIRELESLVDTRAHSPALPAGHPFETIPEGCWSSTTSLYEPRYAWVLYTRDGAVGVGFKAKADFHALAVRRHDAGFAQISPS